MTPLTAAPWRPLPTGALPVRPLPSVVSLLTAVLFTTVDGGQVALLIIGGVVGPITTGLMTLLVQSLLARRAQARAAPSAAPPPDELAPLRRHIATLERENARLRGKRR